MKIIYKLSNPNYRQKLSTVQIMQDLMIAVCGLAAFTVVMEFVQNGSNYGIKALGIYAAAIITGVLTDMLCGKIFKRNDAGQNKYLNTILSPVVTSTIFALTLPVGTPIYVVIVGAFIAIFFGKAVYGGFGKNIFNPALVGRVVVHIAFGAKLVAYLDVADMVSSATPTAALASTNWVGTVNTSLSSLYLGNYAGALGETWALLIIVIGVILAYRKVFDWRIPTSYIATAFILAFVSGCVAGINPFTNALTHIALGGMMFGAVFMATDPVTSPTSPLGKFIYGICLGTLTMLIRLKGTFPEGVLFSILIMNMFTPMIDNLTLGRTDNKYGKQIGIMAAILALGIAIIGGVSTSLKAVEEATPAPTPAPEENTIEVLTVEGLNDGTYTGTAEGFGKDLVATITVEGGKIVDVVFDGPNETPDIGGAALDTLKDQVLAANGSGIDGVSGATWTSNGVKEAINNAIKAASAVTAEGVADGEYTGEAEGFGKELKVTLKVEGGKIVDVVLEGPNETPEIGGVALDTLKEQVLAANGSGIDGVSGATYTSNGVKDAIIAALGGSTGEEAPATVDVASLADGEYTGTAEGFGKNLKVTVTVAGGKITKVVAEGPNETPDIGGAALEELQNQIVAANGTDIDGVSGATWTSDGVKDAVTAALQGGH